MAASAPSDPSESAAAEQRWRRAGTGAATLVAARVITAACGLVQLRIALDHLGTAGLGLWIALTGLLWSAGILDGGIGFAVQNRLTVLFARADLNAAGAVLRYALARLLLIAAAVGVIGVPLAWLAPWASWFGVSDPVLQRQLPSAFVVIVLAGALVVPASLASRVAAARQAMWITGLWTSVSSIIGLGAVVLAGILHLSLTGFIAAGCLLPVLPHVITWLHLRRDMGLAATAGAPSTVSLARDSALFLAPQIGAAFISSFVPTLVTVFAGPVAAASFGVLQRLYGFALQIQTMGLAPTWPAYTHAAAVGDAAFARRAFRSTWVITALAFVAPTLLVTPWVPQIVRLWLGAGAPHIATALLWITALWYVLQFCGQPIAMLLNGVGRIGILAITVWAGLGLALALCMILGSRWGVNGVVAALAIPYLVLNLPITGWHARQALGALGREPKPSS